MDKYNIEEILYIHHWNENLFSIKCTRDSNFKFKNGEFVLIGININNEIISRAYSIVSTNYDNYIEFYSIKVKDGPLTSKLKNLKIFDKILIGRKTTGTLLVNNLSNGENLWLISTGTGLAPFISIIKDLDIYNNFKKIILTHTVRYKDDLSYKYYIFYLYKKSFLKKFKENFIFFQTVTKDIYINNGRITKYFESRNIFKILKLNYIDKDLDRFMICGSNSMIKDFLNFLKNNNFIESKNNILGEYVIEKSFVD